MGRFSVQEIIDSRFDSAIGDCLAVFPMIRAGACIVRMNVQHLPQNIRRWMGDSVGHWEGDTLVIDTTNFTDKTRFRGSTKNLHVDPLGY